MLELQFKVIINSNLLPLPVQFKLNQINYHFNQTDGVLGFCELLLDHVGLPLVVILAVHLVIFCAGWI